MALNVLGLQRRLGIGACRRILHPEVRDPKKGPSGCHHSSQGCSAAKPLVKNAHFRCVLAAGTVDEATLSRQNQVLFGSALCRGLPSWVVQARMSSPGSQGFWRELVSGIDRVAAKTCLRDFVQKPRVETRGYDIGHPYGICVFTNRKISIWV